jgi:hypothetical protein
MLAAVSAVVLSRGHILIAREAYTARVFWMVRKPEQSGQ